MSHCWCCCFVPNNHNNVYKGYYSDYSQLVCLSLLIFLVSHYLFAFTLVIKEISKISKHVNADIEYGFLVNIKSIKKVIANYELYKFYFTKDKLQTCRAN